MGPRAGLVEQGGDSDEDVLAPVPRHQSACGRAGAGAITVSPTPGPWVASSSAAVSRTLWVTTCSTPRPVSSRNGPTLMRRWLTFSPTSPQNAAGIRMEPPPSEACAAGKAGGDGRS